MTAVHIIHKIHILNSLTYKIHNLLFIANAWLGLAMYQVLPRGVAVIWDSVSFYTLARRFQRCLLLGKAHMHVAWAAGQELGVRLFYLKRKHLLSQIFFPFFFETISLYGFGWLGACYVDQAGLNPSSLLLSPECHYALPEPDSKWYQSFKKEEGVCPAGRVLQFIQ